MFSIQAIRPLHDLLLALLGEERLYIVDVGATGGPECRWKGGEKLCFFYTFDPDPRALPWSSPSQNFPTGLWSHRGTQQIHLATYPPATSLFKPNFDLLDAFQAASLLQEMGTRSIDLDTLDHVLAHKPVDFIKIDAEGAELEIMKGGLHILSQQCLGVQLEALFCPFRRNAPTFSDLDIYLRQLDFHLFHLEREHWIRKNKISTLNSAPQLIWGNVLYLLSKKAFLKRVMESELPGKLFAKYILILLAYRLYDYAYEICEALPSPAAEKIKHCLQSLPQSKKVLFPILLSLLIGSGKYALSFSKPSKQHRRNYLIRKIRELGHCCLYLGKNDFALYD